MAGPTSVAGEQTAWVTRRFNRIYRQWQPIWLKLAHAREGIGGFHDGTYLIGHPREWMDHTKGGQPNLNPLKPGPKLLRRRQLARYENFGGKIVDQMKAALFREEPTRRVGEDGQQPTLIEQWWHNIERRAKASETLPLTADYATSKPIGVSKTSINKFWSQSWDSAATFGHMFIAMDRPVGVAPETLADQRLPFLRMYTPLDAIDWLLDDQGNLVEIMFLEAIQRRSLNEIETPLFFNVRLFTNDYWALYGQDGILKEGGPTNGLHQMGRIPVTVLYSRRRNLVPLIGHSVLDDPQLYVDLYNLTSELRELLRNQTFGLLNVQLGQDESIDDAKANLGQQTGTENIVFSKGKAEYISPAAANVDAYRNERSDLLRIIYRLSAIAWEADSKDAEATGSLKLKREDLNQMLSAFAHELERAELEVAELFYRAMFGADRWEQQFETDHVVIQYPKTFDATPFDVLLAQAEAAMALGMPPSFNNELKKRLVPKFIPDCPETLRDQINQDIDAGTQDATALQKTLMARLTAGTPANGQPAAPVGGVPPNLQKVETQSTTEGRMTKVDAAAA